MKEIRAVGKNSDGTLSIHRMIRPEGGWGFGEIKIGSNRENFYGWYDNVQNDQFRADIEKLHKAIKIYSRDVVDETAEKIESGEMEQDDAEIKHWHEVMLKVAENWDERSPGDTGNPKYERLQVAA